MFIDVNNLLQDIEGCLQKTMEQITHAASLKDVNALEKLTVKATELKEMKDRVIAIQSRLQDLRQGKGSESFTSPNSGMLRELIIYVTDGMIKQSYLALTKHIKQGVIRIGDELTIEMLPSKEKIKTILMGHGRLQERGRIRQFYQDASVKVGDSVVLSEITHGRWQLKKI